MRKMNRLWIICSFLLLFLLLTACGGEGDGTTEAPTFGNPTSAPLPDGAGVPDAQTTEPLVSSGDAITTTPPDAASTEVVTEEKPATYPEWKIADFTAWLEDEEFVPAMMQAELFVKMKGYMYQGQSVFDAAPGLFYDGLYRVGYTAPGLEFGYGNDWTSDEEANVDYTNSFYTKVPLDGLMLPASITFEDTLRDVSAKLGIAPDPSANFAPDDGSDVAMTLYRDERYTLVFTDRHLSQDPAKANIPYKLIFTENYTITYESGIVSQVTRTIQMAFDPENKTLQEFRIQVHENYKLT